MVVHLRMFLRVHSENWRLNDLLEGLVLHATDLFEIIRAPGAVHLGVATGVSEVVIGENKLQIGGMDELVV